MNSCIRQFLTPNSEIRPQDMSEQRRLSGAFAVSPSFQPLAALRQERSLRLRRFSGRNQRLLNTPMGRLRARNGERSTPNRRLLAAQIGYVPGVPWRRCNPFWVLTEPRGSVDQASGCGHRGNLRCRCSTTAASLSPNRRRRERRASFKSQSGAIMVNQVSGLSMSP